MLLNQTVVYALRAMAAMAELPHGTSVTVVELSERTGVPQHYLSKVMRRMVRAGLVSGQRGHGGGFSLKKAPKDVPLGAVLVAADADLGKGECAFGFEKCDPVNPCALHPVWTKLQDGLRAFAEDSTLADCGRVKSRRNGKG
jgi:Rrf2 family iron-sulfur cluster assembly transcriptional regulator